VIFVFFIVVGYIIDFDNRYSEYASGRMLLALFIVMVLDLLLLEALGFFIIFLSLLKSRRDDGKEPTMVGNIFYDKKLLRVMQ